MALVARYEALIPVASRVLDDRGAEAVQDRLKAKGYYAVVIPREGGKKLLVTLQGALPPGGEQRPAFEDGKAAQDIQAVSNSLGVRLAAATAWFVEVVKAGVFIGSGAAVVDVGRTAIQGAKEAAVTFKQRVDACNARGGWFCALEAVGVPKWVPPVAIGVVALLVFGQVAQIKRSFFGALGESPSHRRRRR